MKVESDDSNSLKNSLTSVGFPSFPNSAMSQILMASQLMAASGLGLPTNPAFFHPGLFTTTWSTNSPPSPPISAEQFSTALKTRKHNNNNNNNVVSSSSNTEMKRRKALIKLEEITPLSSPTSSTSPPTSTSIDIGNKDPNRDRQFTCGVCKRSFGYKHVLQNHERTHTGEKPFECPECHKKFTRDHHLKTHMRLHTGERPYHCDHCDRQFVQVANLRRHLRVHTGERPYVCEHCQARFSDSNQLKAHLLIHTNEKPFSCERCQSRFRRRHHLLHHKCGAPDKEVVTQVLDDHEEVEDLRTRRILEPLITLPLKVELPEQTEPEDLSMSTRIHSQHSHSSGDSSLSRSPSSREYLEYEDTDPEEAPLFLQRRPPPAHS